FKEMHLGDAKNGRVDGVSGATLTSSAIAEGVLQKLGSKGPSLRFPEEITLAEVRDLDAHAASLRRSAVKADQWEVLDEAGKLIGITVRTAPTSDSVVGYKGPTDTLMLLDAEGRKVRGIRMRKSYDTKRYVGYVTDDSYFLRLFNEMPVDKLAALDFKQAKIEGVSGATETSWAMAEGLKRKAQAMVEGGEKTAGWLSGIRWRWQDTGHVVVLISALCMAFTRLRGIAWARHVHHALLVGYVGLLAGEMLSQALLAGWAKHGTPWRSAPGLVLLGMVALLGPVVTRRQIYCHHVCPHGALQQLLARRLPWQWRVPAGVSRWLERLPMALLAAVLFIVALELSFDLNGLEPFDAYVWRVAGLSTIVIAVIGLVAALFVPLAYCKYGCPTGAVFKLLRYTGDSDRLGKKDFVALLVIACVIALRWRHGLA
ncbi:MAG: 4Fe-4S binding protein, partial [Verrucomicrobiaceae bacterium]|nr:4Fe-4S binding protein [Verrucomicrobiaceae bacterium]